MFGALLIVIFVFSLLYLQKKSKEKVNDGIPMPPEGPTFLEFLECMKAENQMDAVAKFGNVFTVKSPLPAIIPNRVIVNDPALVKELTIKHSNMYRDPYSFTTRDDSFASVTRRVVGTGVTGLKGKEWQWRKNALLKEFHRSKLLSHQRGLLEIVVKEGKKLCEDLEQAADSNTCVQVDYMTTKAAVGVVLFFLFGRELDFDTEQFRQSAKDLMECLVMNLMKPAYKIQKYIPGTAPYQMEQRKKSAWKTIDSVVVTEIDMLLDEYNGKHPIHPNRKPGSVIASLIENEPRFRQGGTNSMIAEARVFVQAGFETTAHSLAFSMGMMAERPDIAQTMATEARAVLCDDPYSVERIEKALKDVPIIKNFFMESIRLYPLAPSLAGTCTNDITIVHEGSTFKLPKGTALNFFNLPLQRHVEDPEAIIPDRWDVPVSDQPFLHTFQNGPHACPGKPLSLLEGQVFLMLAVMQFEFTFPEGTSKVEYDHNLLLRPKDGMPLLVKRRSW